MGYKGWITSLSLFLLFSFSPTALAQPPGSNSGPPAAPPSDLELVERLVAARREYRSTLEMLRKHYAETGDRQREAWARDELMQYHRMLKQSFRLDVGDVPPPNMVPKYNRKDANELFRLAMNYKDKGFGSDFVDNQRRAELLLQKILTLYPESDKIGLVAYQLGDLYEGRAYQQYRRAAAYFERSYQWAKTAQSDARLRAARIYDRVLNERNQAIQLYKQVLSHDIDETRRREAQERLNALTGS